MKKVKVLVAGWLIMMCLSLAFAASGESERHERGGKGGGHKEPHKRTHAPREIKPRSKILAPKAAIDKVSVRSTSGLLKELTTGYYHTCALRGDDSVVCWGDNFAGQLGIETSDDVGNYPEEMGRFLRPVDLGTGHTAKAVVTGYGHTCAIRDDDSVVCWGLNDHGQLGIGNTDRIGDEPGEMGDYLQPVDLGDGAPVKALVAGDSFTCALRTDGSVVCWGLNVDGVLGVGNTMDVGDNDNEMGNNLRAVNLGSGLTAQALVAGWYHVCALRSDGSLVCWGYNGDGQLGIGSSSGRTYKVGDELNEMGNNLMAVDLGTGRKAKAVGAGERFSCALLDDNSVVCWGENENGQLGIGNQNNVGDEPGEMGDRLKTVDLGTGKTARTIAVGAWAAYAVRNDGKLVSWGNNWAGQLGIGSEEFIGDDPNEMGDNLQPVNVGQGLSAAAVVGGGDHACAIRKDGSIVCWGYNDDGELGVGSSYYYGDDPNEMGNNLQIADVNTGEC